MTTPHSTESTMTRKIQWTGVVLLAATVAACGGSTQSMTGTAPSQVSSIAAASEQVESLSLLKEGKGKGHPPAPDTGTPTTGTTPDPDAPEGDGELGKGHGHGKAAIQLEGLATIDSQTDCPTLIITINGQTVTTIDTPEFKTEFQRATCEQLKASTSPSIHLHIAATKMEEDAPLTAIYVRMQGPKFDDGEDADD